MSKGELRVALRDRLVAEGVVVPRLASLLELVELVLVYGLRKEG